MNINALPPGSRLLLARCGVRLHPMVILDNPHVTQKEPLVIDVYGVGDRPWIQAPGLKAGAFMFGKYNNTSYDGGYTLRNLKIDGMGALSHPQPAPRDERRQRDHRFTNRAAFADEATHGVNHVTTSRNIISRNRGMGILGQFNDSVIEDNLFEGNNFSGSDYDHAVYLSGNDSGGRNNVLRNNMFRHNAVVDGVCWGGNVAGQMDCMLIEGNTIEQRASVRSCWGSSITSGYKTA